MPGELLQISREQLDKFSQILDRVMSLQQAYDTLNASHLRLQEEFGRIPKGGYLVPGKRWAGQDSDADSDHAKLMFAHWIRCVINKGKVFKDTPEEIRAALSESTDSAGGYLVPEIFIPELVRIIQLRAIMRNLVRVINMTTDTSNLPSLVSGLTVYWPNENQETTESEPVFGQVTLNAKTMCALTAASMELDEDAQLTLAQLLVTLFGEAVADEEDKQILVGNTNPFKGLLVETGVNQVTMATSLTAFSQVSFQDLLDLEGAITSKAKQNARWYFHRNILTYLRKIRDLNHEYIWAPPAAPGAPATIWGYPYTESDQMPGSGSSGASTNFIGFGNPQYIFLGDRRTFTVASSDHVGFKANQRFWKVTERIAVKVALPAGMSKLRTAA